MGRSLTFAVAPFLAIEGLRLKATLVRLFGPALGELLGGLNLGKSAKAEGVVSLDSLQDLSLGSAPIAHAIEKLMGSLDEDTLIALTKRLMKNVICTWNQDGKNRAIAFATDFDAAFEAVFSQRLFTLYPVIGFVLEVNYPDFFRQGGGGYWEESKNNPHLNNGRRDIEQRARDIGAVGNLSPELDELYPIWRLWHDQHVPLKELQEVWTYIDVMQACAVLDMYSAIETARDGYDKAEADRKAREAEAKSRRAHR